MTVFKRGNRMEVRQDEVATAPSSEHAKVDMRCCIQQAVLNQSFNDTVAYLFQSCTASKHECLKSALGVRRSNRVTEPAVPAVA